MLSGPCTKGTNHNIPKKQKIKSCRPKIQYQIIINFQKDQIAENKPDNWAHLVKICKLDQLEICIFAKLQAKRK